MTKPFSFLSALSTFKKASLRSAASLAFASVLSLGFTTTSSLAAPVQQPVIVDYLGTDYEVTSVTGTFDDNRALLESQIWWGDEAIAKSFLTSLKTPGWVDPFLGDFVFGRHSIFGFKAIIGSCSSHPFSNCTRYQGNSELSGYFATATRISAVPLPAGGILLLSGLAGVVALRRRKKKSA